jgi:hypothetical protein
VTLAQFCLLPGTAKQIEIGLAVLEAMALAEELGVKPNEALYALVPNNEPMEG